MPKRRKRRKNGAAQYSDVASMIAAEKAAKSEAGRIANKKRKTFGGPKKSQQEKSIEEILKELERDQLGEDV